MKIHAFGRLLPLEVARARLLHAVTPTERTETVRLDGAFGRVASRTVLSDLPVPSAPRATWDGYAVRSTDTLRASARRPTTLRLVGELYAEQSFRGRVHSGEAVAVATGATMPPGADAVAIFEDADAVDGSVVLRQAVRPGDRVAGVGHDIPRGTRLVRRGERLGPASLGALAGCGFGTVQVYSPPHVGIVPNGNELLVPGERPRAGAVYESNVPALAAVVRAAGGIPRAWRAVPDDPARIERALRQALKESDLVLATGGSSVGERDHLPRIFPRLGHLLFHGIAVRPGKPTLATRAGTKVVIGLPGHPASCLSNMFWLVAPALRRLARQPGPGWTETSAMLNGPALVPSATMATIVPLARDGARVRSTFRGSSAITSLQHANGFVILPAGSRAVRPGSRLEYFALDPPLGAAPGAPTR